MSLIQQSLTDNIATIAFDNYAKRNALSHQLIGDIIAALEGLLPNNVRAVILRGTGMEKVWSAGHAVDELPRANIDPLPYDEPLEQLFRAVKSFPAPVIAMVHGSVWGGACDLIMNCDLVVADNSATFAITPAKLGVPYNAVGFLNFMSRLPLAVVKEMFFTADPISAQRAYDLGLINKLVTSEDLEEETRAMAATIATRSGKAIAAYKEAIRMLSEAVSINPHTYEYLHGLRRQVYFGAEYKEGITAFLEKRAPKF